jgi:hypothetical protein
MDGVAEKCNASEFSGFAEGLPDSPFEDRAVLASA